MPVPTLISELSTTAASNYPSGTDSPIVLDDVQRAHAAFIAQLRDGGAIYTPAGTGAVASTVQTKLRESVSVLDFYANGVSGVAVDPTGVVDSSLGIQAAIDYMFGLGGGVVWFPRGIYICINVILKDGVTLRSDASAFGYIPGSIATVVLKNATVAGWVIDTSVGGSSVCAIEGISFAGSNAATPLIGGVRIRGGSSWAKIKRCSFNGFALSALQTDFSSVACVIEDILTTNCLLSSTLAAATGVVDISGTDHMITRIESSGSLSARNSANLYFCAIAIKGAQNFISSCVGEFADIGIYVYSSNNSISNCRADNNFGHGWLVQGGENVVSNCRAYNNSKFLANTYSGFYIPSSQSYSAFANCQSYQDTGSVKYGFEDNSVGATNYQQRGTVNNFLSIGHGTAPIYCVYQGAAIQVPNYHMQDAVTGSHTVDVTQVALVYLAQGSAATITNFTGGIFAQTIRVFGNVNVTIANGAGIFTNTGANKTLVANRIYTFTTMGLGTAWYENA